MFDHIAHELTNQQEIYHMIGQECVQQVFEVRLVLARATIAAFLPMDKQEQERLTRYLAIKMTCKSIRIVPVEVYCLGCSKTRLKSWRRGRKKNRLALRVRTLKFTTSKYSILYLLSKIAFNR